MAMAVNEILRIENLSKVYNQKTVVDNISFSVFDGEFLSILGPSGCGKTTLLRLLLGISAVSSGEIFMNGNNITKKLPSERNMGIVFQNYALFPNMTVLGNVEYSLKIRKQTRATAKETALAIIEKVGLTEHINKKPHKLSGGQQQRVAIARTLATNPKIILFDEPMSALDTTIRMQLREELKNLQKNLGITMIYITHDQEEALSMSDRIMVMNEAVIEQIDTPENIIKNPANKYVKTFVVDQLNAKAAAFNKYLFDGAIPQNNE